MNREKMIANIQKDWDENPRWKNVKRTYSAEDVVRLSGSVRRAYAYARLGSEKLWKLLNEEPYINCLGALTGGQAVQQVKAGVKAIYLSGWQVAADANLACAMLSRPIALPCQLGTCGGCPNQQCFSTRRPNTMEERQK